MSEHSGSELANCVLTCRTTILVLLAHCWSLRYVGTRQLRFGSPGVHGFAD